MSNLSQFVSSYLSSWEGHTQSEGDYFIRLRDQVRIATIDEINTEYNALTQQELWVVPVMDIFYEELLNRLLNDTSFAISTAWTSVSGLSGWLNNPFALIRVGFEENYPAVDTDGIFIMGNRPDIQNILIQNEDFFQFQSHVIRLLLEPPISVIIEVTPNQLQIVGLENKNTRVLVPNTKLLGGDLIRVVARMEETGEWNLVRRMYQALRNSIPTIIDPFKDRIINQLLDVTELEDIVDEEGITVVGDTVVEVEEEEEED